MREPGRDIIEELSRDELVAVLAWVIDHYCGTGVVEIEECDQLRGVRITRRYMTLLIEVEES